MPDDYLRERLHDRRFVTTGNPHGVSGAETVFHYRVEEAGISATYAGGRVMAGHVVARATLAFEWGWLSGAEGGGESHYVEVGAAAAAG